MIEYDDEDVIITDKSPYSEYFYQRTKSFDRGLINPQGNSKMEEEIFRYKDIIDNAIIIFLKNKQSWNNYYEREKKIINLSYEMMNKDVYIEMENMFKKYQSLYDGNTKYSQVEIKNDNHSWKNVYKEVEKYLK